MFCHRVRSEGLAAHSYVIGSSGTAALAGAEVFHGGQLGFRYGTPLSDGKIFRLGRGARLAALHTPGHTQESFSFVLTDLSTGSSPVMVFTGDALFVGSVGRLDLYGGGGRGLAGRGLPGGPE
jgi:hydroxyacylglutathione hydrolase